MLLIEVPSAELVKLRSWRPPNGDRDLTYLRYKLDGEPSYREVYVDERRVNGSMPEMGEIVALTIESNLKAVPAKNRAGEDYVKYVAAERLVGVAKAA